MKTHVAVIADMSGSMGGITADTIGGIKQFIKDQRKVAPEAKFNFTVFNTSAEKWIENVALEDVDLAKADNYTPGGGTALLDAVGDTVNAMKKRVKSDDRAIVLILTDGEENSSHRWSLRDVAKMIDKLVKKGNWTFSYIGANVDQFAEASRLGTGAMAANTVSFSPTRGSTMSAMAAVSNATTTYLRSDDKAKVSLYEDAGQKKDHEEK